jgi:hypothetical protein
VVSPHTPLLRLNPSAAVKEKRLSTLLAGRSADAAEFRDLVEDAMLLGSLELSGIPATWDEVRRTRAGAPSPEIDALRAAVHAVPLDQPFSVATLRLWHRTALRSDAGLRKGARERDGGPPPSPATLIPGRLAIAETWLGSDSAGDLKAPEAGALALARLVEILPFDDGNGRVARLAAAHLMRQRRSRPPILVGADGPRLKATLQAAFRLDMAPLVALLEEASERGLDVLIQALEGRR